MLLNFPYKRASIQLATFVTGNKNLALRSSRTIRGATQRHGLLLTGQHFFKSSNAMFSRAACTFEQNQSQTKSKHAPNAFIPPKRPADTPSQNDAWPIVRSPLAAMPLATLNGARKLEGEERPVRSGVKRTSDGLAKVAQGSFEKGNDGAYQQNGRGEPGLLPRSGIIKVSNEVFDLDDFDEDVDLDVEECMPRMSQKPQGTDARLSSVSRMFSPTAFLSQQASSGITKAGSSGDSGYLSVPIPTIQQSSPSSSAIPWSSSPAEHFAPSRPDLNRLLNRPADSTNVNSIQDQVKTKRTIPWITETNAAMPVAPSTQTQTTSRRETKPVHDRTPFPSKRKKTEAAHNSPWNTSASTIKEQVKQHREETRKAAIKLNAASEEDVQKAKSSRGRPARVFLSDEQQHVLDLVVEKNKSVFFTGSAGTGKSVLMREIISSMRRKHLREPDRVAVTASTGLAACNIGGVTLHSFAGIGLGKEDVPELVRKIKRNQKAKHRWMRTKILIVDEISMVDADLFDKLEAIARQMRNNGRPFGGIQLVITGDFFQLPPVPDYGRIAKFAFDATTWSTAIQHTIGLHHVFRQKDPVFAGMLNEMREGRLSDTSIKAFKSLSRDLKFEDSIVATELFPTRAEVEYANGNRLGMLQGREAIFQASDGGSVVDKGQRDKLLSNCMAPETITLKKGAQVMLIKNVDETLVNGSLGQVMGFMSEAGFDSYSRYDQDSTSGITATANNNNIELDEVIRKGTAQFGSGGVNTSREYPVVRFGMADGTSRDMLCQPEQWKVELPNGEVQASRTQIPLILAWALSIHKAQGQTLDRVKVDLGKVFEKGQAYVALSRATSMAGLQVLRFDAKKVIAHDKVRSFYSNLSRFEEAEKMSKQGKAAGKPAQLSAQDYERTHAGQQ